MAARWISVEEYYALGDGLAPESDNSAGINASKNISGQVLESTAGPQTLEQKDYQGTALVHDVLTQGGFNETETSNKVITYNENVRSTLIERAPNISKTYQQNQNYSENYQTKTETIQAQNYERTISSPNYSKQQNQLNLNVPHNLNVNVTESLKRTVGTRNLSVDTHMMSGDTFDFNGGTIKRFGNITIIKGDYVQLRANNFMLHGGAADAAPVPVKPRRAPPDMIAKVSGTFASKSISLPTAYDANYMMQVVFTVSGEYEMESAHSVNPLSLDKDGLQAEVTKTLGNFFYGMQVTQAHDQGVDQGIVPSFVMGNRYGDYVLTNGIKMSIANPNLVIFNYSTSISKEKEFVDTWLLTLTAILEVRITFGKRTTLDNIEIETNSFIQKANKFLQENVNDRYYGPLIRALNTYTRPIINSMYQETVFLDSMVINDAAFIEL